MKVWPLLALLATALPAQAQVLEACDERSSVWNVYHPWEENIRTFANGQVRVVEVDTNAEPVGHSAYLVVLAPGAEGLGCWLFGSAPGLGWADVDVQGIATAYNPAKGLRLVVPVGRYDPAQIEPGIEQVTLLINQAAGRVTIEP